jgi:membrane fusion protein, multidrug efflux system
MKTPVLACLLTFLTLAAAQAQQADGDESVTCILKPREIVHLGSAVPGLLDKVLVDRGDTVKHGQVVAQLESSIEQVSLALARAKAANDGTLEGEKAEYDMLRRKLDRTRPLADQRIASQSSLEEVESKLEESRDRIRSDQFDIALASLEAERAQRELNLRQISSSVDGVVTERKLAPGEYVYEQTPIMTIAQIDPLNVEVVLPASRYGTIHVGGTATVQPTSPIGGHYPAKVEVVDPVIDAASNTFGVRLTLSNPDNHIPAGIRCSMSW